jgi:ketopantoate reductase
MLTAITVVKFPVEAQRTFDYVVCAHKAIGQSFVPAHLAPVVDAKKTTLVIIQNGVGNEEPFRSSFADNTIITCVVRHAVPIFPLPLPFPLPASNSPQTWVGALQTSPGVVKHTKSEYTQIGLFPNPKLNKSVEQGRLDTFTALLKVGGTPFDVDENMQSRRWEKVVWNAAWNSFTTLTLLDTQSWLKSENGDALTRQLMREVIDVARSCDVPLSYDYIDELINKILKMPAIHSSMHADRVGGRQMEVEIILGTPVRKAKEFGIAVPVLTTIYTLLTGLNVHLEQQQFPEGRKCT